MFQNNLTWGPLSVLFILLVTFHNSHSYATLHGMQCNSTTECGDGMDCTMDTQGTHRCLCTDEYYRNDSGNCTLIKSLQYYCWREVTTDTIVYYLVVSDKSDVEFTTVISNLQTKEKLVTYESFNYEDVYITGLRSNTFYRLDIYIYSKNSTYYTKRLLKSNQESIQTALAYSEICTDESECEYGTVCIEDKSNITRCLCEESEFRTEKNFCESLVNLQISNVSSNSDTSFITIHWTKSMNTKTSSKYLVSYDNDEELIVTEFTDVTIENLQSGREYEFHIIVFIPPDNYYDNKTGTSYIHKAFTVADYGDTCSSYIKCAQWFLCRATVNRSRCLCNVDNYRIDSNRCQHKDNLQVTNVTVRRTASSITLSWQSSTVGTKNAQFTIYDGLYGSLTASATGGSVKNLTHGTHFTFSIAVTLKDNYVNQTGPIYYSSVSTLSVYGQECDTNEDCDQGAHCLSAVNDTSRCLCKENEHRSATDQCETSLRDILTDDAYKMKVIIVSCVLSAIIVVSVASCVYCAVRRKAESRRNKKIQARGITVFEDNDDYDVLKIDVRRRDPSCVAYGADNVYSACENDNNGMELNHYIQPISGDIGTPSGYYNTTVEQNMGDEEKTRNQSGNLRKLNFPEVQSKSKKDDYEVYENKIV